MGIKQMTINKNKKGNSTDKSVKKKNIDFISKKDWFEVSTPREFGEKSLGLTLFNKAVNISRKIESLKNRNYKINLIDIKNSEDSSHKKLTFRCHNYDEKTCLTRFNGFDTTRDKFFSLIRKWHTMIELNSDLRTKDGYFIRVFVVAFSRKRKNQSKKTSYIKASQTRTIRRKIGEILIREGTTCLMKDLIPKLISEKLPDEINFICSKIFPLQNIMVRKVKIL